MSWHVLTDGERYWGQQWEIYNTALRRPRSVMGDLQDATLCIGDGIEAEIRLARSILGIDAHAVTVEIEGRGPKAAKIVPARIPQVSRKG
jgi:hypothetical protein